MQKAVWMWYVYIKHNKLPLTLLFDDKFNSNVSGNIGIRLLNIRLMYRKAIR